jgi:glycosyltransferase involved in cell wall biosynthesis
MAGAMEKGLLMENNKPLSILIPVLEFGRAGGYRVLSKLADEWISHGCSVAFLAPYWSDPPYYPTKAEIHWVDAGGCDVEHRPNIKSPVSKIRKSMRFFSALTGLMRGISKIKGPWDIVLANQSITAWPVALAFTSASKVYYIQAYEPKHYHKKKLIDLVLKGISWGSYFLPLQRIVNAPLFLNYRSCRASVWFPPGIDLNTFHPGTKDKQFRMKKKESGLTVGCIGRIEPQKGTVQAIQAYLEFIRKVPGEHRFRIANFGVPAEWLQGIPGIESAFPSNDADLADYYRSIDVLIALGTIEQGGHHYPVLEAMATHVSIITTGYMPANSMNAWIVGANSVEASKALEEIFSNPGLAEAKCCNADAAIRVYDWTRVGAEFLQELNSIHRKMRI